MTETLPFAPPQEQAGVAPEETGSGRKVEPRLLALGATVLVLAVGGGAFFLLRGGGDGSTTVALPPLPTHHVTAPARASAAGATATAAPIARYTGAPAGRDPFKPLVVAPPPSGSPTGATGAPSAAGPSAVPIPLPTAAAPSPGPAGTGGGTPGNSTGGGSTTAANPVTLLLHAIVSGGTQTPQVEVVYDGQAHQMKVGDTLDGTVKLVSVQPDDGVATFQIGDGTYDLHVGQQYNG